MGYAFGGLIGDIGGWLLLGVVISTVISLLIPAHFFETHASGRFSSMFAMLLLGTPLYVCATASTPIAAALMLKGLSPGAALVFLLAGPATNATTLTVVSRMLGKRIAFLYVGSIACCSMLLGWGLDQIYAMFQVDTQRWIHVAQESTANPLTTAASILLLLLIAKNYLPNRGRRKQTSLQPRQTDTHSGC